MSCFQFYLFSFFLYKIGEQEGGTSPAAGGGGTDTSERWEVLGKGYRRVNTVQKMCTHACKCKKLYLLKLIQEWGVKENGRGGEFMYDIFEIL
jgi:hypothetical protein